jgi:hypothetical protein
MHPCIYASMHLCIYASMPRCARVPVICSSSLPLFPSPPTNKGGLLKGLILVHNPLVFHLYALQQPQHHSDTNCLVVTTVTGHPMAGTQAGRQDGARFETYARGSITGRHGRMAACRMAGWQHGRMAGWQDGRMAGWQDGSMAWQHGRWARPACRHVGT